MVAFNPDVPDQRDPNYLRYSQGTQTPEGNKSAVYAGQSAMYQGQAAQHLGEAAGYVGKAAEYAGQGLGDLFKGIGDVFTSGIKAADQFVKKNIDQDVYSAVDAERNNYTQQLERVSSGPDQSGQFIDQGTMPSFVRPGTKPPGAAMDLTSTGASAPDSVEKGLARVDTLVAARANDKMTETMYIGQLDAIAKNLRAQYPGYREYIDQKISEITGMQPANAYVKSLIQDINASTSATKSEYDKAQAAVLKEVEKGTPYSNIMMQRLRRTGDVEEAYNWISKVNAQNYYWDNRKKFYENNKLGREDQSATAITDFNQLAPQIIDNHMNAVLAGTNIGMGTAKNIEEFVQNAVQGRGPKPDTATMQQLGTILKSQSIDVANAMRTEAIRIGMYQKDPVGVEKQIEAHLSRYNQMADFIYNDKWGPAYSVKNANTAVVEDLHNQVLTSKDLGPFARFAEMAEKIGPTYSQKFFTNSVITDSALNNKVKEFIKGVGNDMATQADPSRQPDLLSKGPTTFKGTLQKLGDTGNGTYTATQAALSNFNWLYDPSVEDVVKRGYAIAAFDPNNRGMLNQIQKDRIDPATGKRVKGQIDVFEQFTNPAVTKEIVRLSNTSPEGRSLLLNYRDWAHNEFENVLFRQDLATLRDIQLNPGMSISWNSDTGQFTLNRTRTPRFDPNNNIPSRTPDVIAARAELAQSTIDRLNRGLANIKGVNDAVGMDNNAYVVQALANKGVDLRGVGGMRIPEQLLKSVVSSQKSNFSEEQNPQKGSLGEFLANPGGITQPRVQNAPAASRTRIRGNSTNLSDQEITGIDTTDIPTGVDPKDWMRALENARRVR